MTSRLKERFETFYRDRVDPWDYWTSSYEITKYHEQISLVAQFGTPKRILEIACSTGSHTKLIHEAFPDAHITAVDISPTAIDRASANVAAPESVTFHAADIFAFAPTLTPQSFDAVFWSEGFDFVHEHCTIADFSRLVRTLNLAMAPAGVLCVSHVVPRPLSLRPFDAGDKNVRVFHDLISDYFRAALKAGNTLRKVEVERSYYYEITLYQPRVIDFPTAGRDEIHVEEVDVVIPARDEAATIGRVVSTVIHAPLVRQVIVVDNGSADGTAKAASDAGAAVVRCAERGYGRAVKHGVSESSARWILKLDADIENVRASWVDLIIAGAVAGKSRLVKTCWPPSVEDPERVTNFTVKPALRIFFPELLFLHTPLSGIYLFDKTAFPVAQMPNDFSFDLAMLISALKARLAIGQIEIESVRHATIASGKRTYQYYFNMADELLRYLVEAGFERFQ